MNIKYFIGPMTLNVVTAVMEFCEETGNVLGFIPSRRQIAIDGGYVNNWTTDEFRRYTKGMFLVRDHAGPGQGKYDDDGYASLEVDCKNMDMIHVDPWKKYPVYEDGLIWTVQMIKFCHHRNPNIFFEVGTEESIRRFEAYELDKFLSDLKKELEPEQFKNIKYCVIQSGTSLEENKNTGAYDEIRLREMITTVGSHGLLTKEHNGDYLPPHLIKEKFSLGLDSINIAPEFGQIETKTILKKIKEENPKLLNLMWEICYNSKKWEKWVGSDFSPTEQKEELINICGHYVLSQDLFLDTIKTKFSGIDEEIKKNVKNKLRELI